MSTNHTPAPPTPAQIAETDQALACLRECGVTIDPHVNAIALAVNLVGRSSLVVSPSVPVADVVQILRYTADEIEANARGQQ